MGIFSRIDKMGAYNIWKDLLFWKGFTYFLQQIKTKLGFNN